MQVSEDLKISLFLFLSGLGGTAIISYIIFAFVIIPSSQPFFLSAILGTILLIITCSLPFSLMIIGLCSLIDIIIGGIKYARKYHKK